MNNPFFIIGTIVVFLLVISFLEGASRHGFRFFVFWVIPLYLSELHRLPIPLHGLVVHFLLPAFIAFVHLLLYLIVQWVFDPSPGWAANIQIFFLLLTVASIILYFVATI